MYFIMERYGKIEPYCVKNVIKGIYLCILFVGASVYILPNEYDNALIKTFASLYVSNDFLGILKVKIATTTMCHHLVAIVLLLYCWNTDFSTDPVARMVLMMTYVSSMSFGVNLYLGLRKLDNVEWLRPIVSKVYLLSFCLNLIVQWHLYEDSLYARVYLLMLGVILIDDLYLLKWLFKGI